MLLALLATPLSVSTAPNLPRWSMEFAPEVRIFLYSCISSFVVHGIVALLSLMPLVCDLSCQNGGECLLSQDDEYCACPSGFGGPSCETELNFEVEFSTADASRSRTNFAIDKPLWISIFLDQPTGVTIVGADLYQVGLDFLTVIVAFWFRVHLPC